MCGKNLHMLNKAMTAVVLRRSPSKCRLGRLQFRICQCVLLYSTIRNSPQSSCQTLPLNLLHESRCCLVGACESLGNHGHVHKASSTAGNNGGFHLSLEDISSFIIPDTMLVESTWSHMSIFMHVYQNRDIQGQFYSNLFLQLMILELSNSALKSEASSVCSPSGHALPKVWHFFHKTQPEDVKLSQCRCCHGIKSLFA